MKQIVLSALMVCLYSSMAVAMNHTVPALSFDSYHSTALGGEKPVKKCDKNKKVCKKDNHACKAKNCKPKTAN